MDIVVVFKHAFKSLNNFPQNQNWPKIIFFTMAARRGGYYYRGVCGGGRAVAPRSPSAALVLCSYSLMGLVRAPLLISLGVLCSGASWA